MRRFAIVMLSALVFAWPGSAASVDQQTAPARTPDVGFVPTRPAVAEAMLDMAKVTSTDVVYDLGCGDGQIVMAAAKRGARVVGVDIDPQRVKEAQANVKKAGLADRATIIQGDIFDPAINVSEASVVTLYLLAASNVKLRPILTKTLRPGARIVTHNYPIGDWEPDVVDNFTDAAGTTRTLFLWNIR